MIQSPYFPQCRQQKWTYLAMRSRVKSSICPVILRPAKNCKFLTAFSICWCDRILSAKFDLGRQPNCIRQSSTFLLQSIIELTACLHEFPEYESTNFSTNIFNVLSFYPPKSCLRSLVQFLGSKFSFSADISYFYAMMYNSKT